MIKDKYLEELRKILKKFDKKGGLKFFVYGSSLEREHFGDIDLGVIGDIDDKKLVELKWIFEESDFPYFVDVVDFNEVSEEFRNNVLNNKILWIEH